jgi:hypothetical protein
MAASATEIGNLALAHLGSGVQIASLTERSAEARAVSLWYAQTRDEVLGAFPWPFALRTVELGLVQENPTDEWGFSYRYPAAALTIWRIVGFDRIGRGVLEWNCWPWAAVLSPPPFRVLSDDLGQLVYCDLDAVTVEYTVRLETVERFPADFVNAIALKLAEHMGPLVTKGDQFKLGARAGQLYVAALAAAQARAANEERADRWNGGDSDLVRSRL